MNIWIMRHAEADFNAKTDNQRTLSIKGEKMAFEQGQLLGERLKNQGVLLDKILVSPYVRAQQTYHKLLEGLQAVDFVQSFANITETWEAITPSGSPKIVADYLTFLRDEGAKNVLLISHLPLVFDLVLELTSHQHQVHFYPAVIVELKYLDQIAELVFIQS